MYDRVVHGEPGVPRWRASVGGPGHVVEGPGRTSEPRGDLAISTVVWWNKVPSVILKRWWSAVVPQLVLFQHVGEHVVIFSKSGVLRE